MRETRTFGVVGGDLRQVHLARLLTRDGYRVFTYAQEQGAHLAPDAVCADSPDCLSECDCVILPLPVCSSDGMLFAPLSAGSHPLCAVLDRLSPSQLLFGGKPNPAARDMLSARGLTLHDYFAQEALTISNAIPTAEGAVQLAMEQLPVTIHGLDTLVLGYGRVGRMTAGRFAALGAHVTVAARRPEQRACAAADGLGVCCLPPAPSVLSGAELVINTISALILDRAALSSLQTDCLILDLASAPGGTDVPAAEELGVRVIHALSLPGKVAPASAGGYIRDAVLSALQEIETQRFGKEEFC